MTAHQAPPSLGFSRQEHWNGLPFPSPMHESENWKWNSATMCIYTKYYGEHSTMRVATWTSPWHQGVASISSDWIMISSSKFLLPAIHCFLLQLPYCQSKRAHKSFKALSKIHVLIIVLDVFISNIFYKVLSLDHLLFKIMNIREWVLFPLISKSQF